jgi:hypothetical protein
MLVAVGVVKEPTQALQILLEQAEQEVVETVAIQRLDRLEPQTQEVVEVVGEVALVRREVPAVQAS